jgi:hypothetical protein
MWQKCHKTPWDEMKPIGCLSIQLFDYKVLLVVRRFAGTHIASIGLERSNQAGRQTCESHLKMAGCMKRGASF